MAAAQAGQTRADEIAAAPITRTLGPTVTLLLFALGLVVGVAVQSYISPPPPATPYAELSLVNEPPEAAALVRLIVADDARGISAVMEGEVLQALGAALRPLREVFEMKFVGAVERRGDILASYVATGREQNAQSFSVGVVFRVSGGEGRRGELRWHYARWIA